MTNADKFLDMYKQLEEVVRVTYGLGDSDSISYFLTKEKKYKNNKEAIKYCQDVRNILSHKKKIDKNYPVEPSDSMIEYIEKLIERIKNRSKCSDIQVTLKNIYWQDITGSVKDTMKIMQEKTYTHIPILEDNIVIGVFDENSIFNYLASEEIVEIDDELTFSDIKDYIGLDDREMEQFIFVKSTEYVEEVERKIENAFKKGIRIGIAFVTNNGKPSGSLQGIITPWDIIALDD